MCRITKGIAFWLVIIGALNWGLVGLFNFDLVSFLFGDMSIWTKIVYVVVGFAALIYASLIYVYRNEAEC